MIAVLFELEPLGGQRDAYLALAAELKPVLEEIDGFVSIERFQSLSNPDKLLSLSVFRDEAAVAAWRNTMLHRRAQAAGRVAIFRDYRLRVASVLRDYGMTERAEAPADSRAAHGPGRLAADAG
nr:antibiotic biosynthesis monooxygenase [Thalassobaculum salexigens]